VADFCVKRDKNDRRYLSVVRAGSEKEQKAYFKPVAATDDVPESAVASWETQVSVHSKKQGLHAEAKVRIVWESIGSGGSSNLQVHVEQAGSTLRHPKTMRIADSSSKDPIIWRLRGPEKSLWDL
jgi:predicted methyltransferase